MENNIINKKKNSNAFYTVLAQVFNSIKLKPFLINSDFWFLMCQFWLVVYLILFSFLIYEQNLYKSRIRVLKNQLLHQEYHLNCLIGGSSSQIKVLKN